MLDNQWVNQMLYTIILILPMRNRFCIPMALLYRLFVQLPWWSAFTVTQMHMHKIYISKLCMFFANFQISSFVFLLLLRGNEERSVRHFGERRVWERREDGSQKCWGHRLCTGCRWTDSQGILVLHEHLRLGCTLLCLTHNILYACNTKTMHQCSKSKQTWHAFFTLANSAIVGLWFSSLSGK